MHIISVIQAKGGCGKSTLAINLAAGLAAQQKRKVLLIDLDPQAQLTDWLVLGDGLRREGSIASVFLRENPLNTVIQATHLPNLDFVASCQPLEAIGHTLAGVVGHESMLAEALDGLPSDTYAFGVIDSPNQISPIMENAILPADLFVVPFESTKAVTAYANLYHLLHRLRPQDNYRALHLLNNLARPGQRRAVIQAMQQDSIPQAKTEVRSCGWLAKVDRHGGSIFHYRPRCRGAHDILQLRDEIIALIQSKEKPREI